MTARGRRSIVAAMVVTALAIPTTAIAQEAPFTVSIENLAPGVPESTSFTYGLAQDALFRSLTWTGQTGILESADLGVEVCSDGACVDGDNPDDTVLPAGPVTITVTATISGEAPQNSSGTASGELVFVAADVATAGGADGDVDEELPFTGAWFLEMGALAAALISIGALLATVARRRDTEDAAP